MVRRPEPAVALNLCLDKDCDLPAFQQLAATRGKLPISRAWGTNGKS